MDGGGEIHDVPMRVITRPLVPSVDEAKVASLCETIQSNPGAVPPVTVLWVKGASGGDYYFAFGGCHRYEAHKRLNKSHITAIVQKTSVEALAQLVGPGIAQNLK